MLRRTQKGPGRGAGGGSFQSQRDPTNQFSLGDLLFFPSALRYSTMEMSGGGNRFLRIFSVSRPSPVPSGDILCTRKYLTLPYLVLFPCCLLLECLHSPHLRLHGYKEREKSQANMTLIFCDSNVVFFSKKIKMGTI